MNASLDYLCIYIICYNSHFKMILDFILTKFVGPIRPHAIG